MISQVQGGGTLKTFTATLAAGTVTIKTGLAAFVVLSVLQWHASAISARKYGIIGTPNTSSDQTAQGMFNGDLVITADASATDTVVVTVYGW